jgi:type IV pilus assembly protein PilW
MQSHMTSRQRNQGFSIVELMVATTIAMLTAVVVLQVLNTYEARKRTVTIGNDAEINGAVGLYMVEREVRMAGAGFTTPTGLLCGNGINAYYDPDLIADGGAGDTLAVVQIADGGAGPDSIRVLRSESDFGVAPGTIVVAMATADADITVDGNVGLVDNDLFLAGAADGSKICTLMQMTDDPEPTGNGWALAHDSGGSDYNPANPATTFTTPIRYEVGDVVFNLGQLGLREFGVICNDGAAPSLTNACNLVTYDAVAVPAPLTLAAVESIASQVVDFQLQYGIAPAGSQTVNDWVDATGGWAAPSPANQQRIKAVRMSIVTRGNLERTMVSPDTLFLWDQGTASERSIALTDDQRYYRYKVLTVVVPLINIIWSGV